MAVCNRSFPLILDSPKLSLELGAIFPQGIEYPELARIIRRSTTRDSRLCLWYDGKDPYIPASISPDLRLDSEVLLWLIPINRFFDLWGNQGA